MQRRPTLPHHADRAVARSDQLEGFAVYGVSPSALDVK